MSPLDKIESKKKEKKKLPTDLLVPRLRYNRCVVLYNFEKTYVYQVRMTYKALDRFIKEKAHEVDCTHRQTYWRYAENVRWCKAQTEIRNRAWVINKMLEISRKYRSNEKSKYQIV